MPYLIKRWFGFLSTSLLVVLGLESAVAQNYSVQNAYQINPFVINPAAAGSDFTQAYSAYRAQWVTMPGAPRFISVGFNTLLDKTRAGVGFKGSSFTRGFLTTNDFSASFAYGVPINKTNTIFMGLSGGLLMQSINWSMVTDDTDPALASFGKAAIPSVSFGALLKNSSGFHFGFTMPQLIRSETLSSNFQVVPDNLVVMAYYSNWHPQTGVKSHNRSKKHASNKKDGNPLEFFSLYRYTRSGGQAEAFVKYNAKGAFATLGYRQRYGIIPGVGFVLGQLSLQYTYESGLGGEIPLKSHEFALMVKLGEKKTFKGDTKTKNTPPGPANPKPRFPSNPVDEPKLSKANKGRKNTAVASNKNVQEKNNTTSGNTPRNRPPDTNLNNVEEKKNPVVTEEKKNPVVTEEKKNPVVTEEKKNPVVTEEKKNPVVTEEKKNPVVTEEKKNPVVTEEKKNPVVTEEKKNPVVTEEKKNPVVTEEKKNPVVTEEKKNPVVTEEKKNPVVTEEKKEPVLAEEKKSVSAGEVVHLTEEEQAAHEEDVIQRLDEHSDNPTEEHAEDDHPHAERHEFWARGNHEKELEIGHYVIVGVFKSEANAKRVSDGYRNLGFSEVDFGYQSGKGFWFVHIAGSEDMDVPDAQKLRNKYRKMKMFRDAWLLTVHQ